MTLDQLLQIMPAARHRAAGYLGPLNDAMKEFSITGKKRQASFLSQIAHESGHLVSIVENLNYSAAGLLATWPSRFNVQTSAQYARQPEKIANRVYADRMGNGSEASGDGWRFRGRGLIQITGTDNYKACGAGLGYDLLAHPQFLESQVMACRSAAWWWRSNGLNSLADAGDQRAVGRRINGGDTGQADRLALFAVADRVLV